MANEIRTLSIEGTQAQTLIDQLKRRLAAPDVRSFTIELWLRPQKTLQLGNAALSSNVWSHLLGRYDAAKESFEVLVNGVAVTAPSRVPPSASVETALRGLKLLDGKGLGTATEIRLWSEARSDEQMRRTIYCRAGVPGRPGPWKDLLERWPSELAEESLRGQRNTDGSEPPLRWTSPEGRTQEPVSAGVFRDGAHLEFEGDAILTFPGNLCVEAWVRPDPSTGPIWQFPVLSQHASATGWELRCSGEQASFIFYANRSEVGLSASGIVAGEWTHLAGVFDGSTLLLFVNGVLRDRNSVNGKHSPARMPISIGRNSFFTDKPRQFSGEIAEVRIWQNERRLDEIQTAMYERCRGNESGLAVLLPLDKDFRDRGPSRYGIAQKAARSDRGAALPSLQSSSVPLLPTATMDASSIAEHQEPSISAAPRSAATLRRPSEVESKAPPPADEQTLKSEIQKLQTELATRASEVEGLKSQLGKLKVDSGATFLVEDLIENLQDQLQRNRAVLRKKGCDYSLSRVSLELKVVPMSQGGAVSLPTREELKQIPHGNLSQLVMEFSAEESGALRPTPMVKVPLLLGYTQAMALRKLGEQELLMKVCYEAVEDDDPKTIRADRVVNQDPAPFESVAQGTTVTIFIGRVG